MKEKEEVRIGLEPLTLLSCFTVRETLRTLQAKDLITDQELDAILARAVEGLHMSTIGLSSDEMNHLLNVLMGRPFTTPPRNLN